MNPTTAYLLQVIGPAYLAIGVGMLINPTFYRDMIKGMKNNMAFMVWAAMGGIIAGLSILFHHNLWSTLPEVLMSLVGVGAVVKGLHILLAPKSWLKMAESFTKDSILRNGSYVVTLIGLYLVWAGYFG